jgi:hypothetical protein
LAFRVASQQTSTELRSVAVRQSPTTSAHWSTAPSRRATDSNAVSAPGSSGGPDCYSAAIAVATASPAMTLASRNAPIARSSILNQLANILPLSRPNSGAGATADGASSKRTPSRASYNCRSPGAPSSARICAARRSKRPTHPHLILANIHLPTACRQQELRHGWERTMSRYHLA